jgi:hypothetical protein
VKNRWAPRLGGAGRVLAALLVLGSSGCRLIGPTTIDVSRVRYNSVIQSTGNEQMLLNLVRLRYSDTPFFLEVASVSTAFEFTAGGSLGVSIDPTSYLLGSGVELAEQPTITYTPLQGEQFVKSLLTPLDLPTLLLLYHSGWAIDRVLRVAVQELNDVPNAPSASGPTPKRAPEYQAFLRAVQILRQLQLRGDISLSGRTTDEGPMLRLQLEPEAVGTPEHRELATILTLDPSRESYELVGHDGLRRPDRIALVTRSLMASFFYVSQGVEVPAEDERAGRVTVTRTEDGERFDWKFVTDDLFRVHQAERLPDDASVHTHYRERWFYIADADLESESTFALLMQLFSLQSGNVQSGGPILTLPVGR